MTKFLAFILLILFGAGLYSCQSEYSQRLTRGVELKKELIQLLKTSGASNQFKLNEIREELAFHAKVSGNEDLFFKELGMK
jgi:hypothetical protein